MDDNNTILKQILRELAEVKDNLKVINDKLWVERNSIAQRISKLENRTEYGQEVKEFLTPFLVAMVGVALTLGLAPACDRILLEDQEEQEVSPYTTQGSQAEIGGMYSEHQK